jgi:hypothetical protein
MDESLRSEGKSIPYEIYNGLPVFDYYKANPNSAYVFNQSMTAFSTPDALAIVEAYKDKWRAYET